MSHQPLPWREKYGGIVDANGEALSLFGGSCPGGRRPPDDPVHCNRDLILRAVTELNEDARQQVIEAAEERGAVATREAIAKGLEAKVEAHRECRAEWIARECLVSAEAELIRINILESIAAQVRAGELG